ncbi:MAG: VCBS repeat-containing protein [Oscillospiraceae bacterium]|nr:VCBS repeat-containing protein [Oscillospiraceae bacterium]
MKNKWYVCLMMFLPLLLSGCMMMATVEELYALPKLPAEYQALSAQIESILAHGAETTSPTSGANLQSVQLEDLDGDGEQEAIAFFRNNNDERPMKIYIFRAVDEVYEKAFVIEGSGTSIHSIRYLDMNGDGVKELLVSWRVSAQVQALSVYGLDNLQPVVLISTAYARYEATDLDSDDVLELVVVRSDESETGGSLADYYDWDDMSLVLCSSARLSVTVGELQWIQEGVLSSGERAVFLTGRVAGVEETSRAVTDILTYRDGVLSNIVLSQSTGVSSQIARFMNLQPTDIDGDGVTEVPMPAALHTESENDEKWKIYWFGYHANGTSIRRAITYHNLMDSWYLRIPDSWDGHFTVVQKNISSTEHATIFYSMRGRRLGEELLTIYTFTGENREAQAVKGERQILRRQPNVVYAVTYTQDYAHWRYAIEPNELAERFSAITSQWSTGEE